MIKTPNLNWELFDKDNKPHNLQDSDIYLILIRKTYNSGVTKFYTDIANPNGCYLDNFWDTANDWYDDNDGDLLPKVEVLAYAKLSSELK